jgi:SagB-type dehydrogenase family enzyme
MNLEDRQLDILVSLPPPETRGGMPLHEVLHRRRSCRNFSARPLTMSQLAQLCWSAQGITHREGFRTAPSAGAIYPACVLLASPNGLFEYLPDRHALRTRKQEDIRRHLEAAALDQECVGGAPVIFIIAVNPNRLARKYGNRAVRYATLEAGHIAQNVLLQAVALGLNSVPVGAFEDQKIAAALDLPGELEPTYLLPIGHPL